MNQKFRIVDGTLKIEKTNQTFEVKFGIVTCENGVYFFDVYLKDQEGFYDSYYQDETLFNHHCTLAGITEKNYELNSDSLSLVSLSSKKNSRIKLKCLNFIELISPNENEEYLKRNKINKEIPIIHFLEIEGLNLLLSDFTFNQKIRNGKEMKEYPGYESDHYKVLMRCNSLTQVTSSFELIFQQSNVNNNIIIEFIHKENNSLFFSSYQEIKLEFTAFLSFINNGLVKVRRELFGTFISKNSDRQVDSSKVNLFSFPIIEKPSRNEYLNIHQKKYGGNKELHTLFMNCFDSFILENKTFDFCGTIRNLNNTTFVSLEERYYILITVLEKLASNLNKSQNQPANTTVISSDIFDLIKEDLRNALKSHESLIPISDDYNNLMSRLCQINHINRNGTSQKLKSLFQYAGIPLTSEIENLITNERNGAVHEGKTGNSINEQLKNYYKLDHVIRDIILNIIGYDGFRGKRVEY